MKTAKEERLQSDGWKIGNAEDFLKLSDGEARLVALKVSLVNAAKEPRDIQATFPSKE